MATKITFDPVKREVTLRERGLDFLDAASVFEGRTYTIEDRRWDSGEVRYQTVGFLNDRMVWWCGRRDPMRST